MTTISGVVGKLQAQGSSRQVADFLEQQEITGKTGNSFLCPVAKYLKRETEAVRPCVSSEWVEDYGRIASITPIDDYSPLQEFIREFDRGEYPKLIEP